MMSPDHIQWCKGLHASLNEGGKWIVPRSGLVFRREGESLVLVDRLTGFTDAEQDGDVAAIIAHFEAAGIDVFEA